MLAYNSIEKAKNLIKNYKDDQKVLPTSISNNIKCLDYDMDNVVFKFMTKSPTNVRGNKKPIDGMEMV
jgi:hypothetical protein